MIELIRTNDLILISWLTAHLEGAGIGHVVLDAHTSVLEGSIGAIPRRVMVLATDEEQARTILDARPDVQPHALHDDVTDQVDPADMSDDIATNPGNA